MHPTLENLEQDHRRLEPVLDELRRIAHELLASRPVDPGYVRQCVAFVADFLDQGHFRKREDFLFPALLAVPGIAGSGSLEELRADHARARRHLAELRAVLPKLDMGTVQDRWSVAVALSAYREAIHHQLAAEERGLFRMAEQSLDAWMLQLLEDQFREVDAGLQHLKPPVGVPSGVAG